MKLHGENILFFDDCPEIRPVIANRDCFSIRVCGGERVCEIKVRVRRDAFEKPRRLDELELVPPHVRELDGRGKGTNGAWQETQTTKLRSLFAGFIQRLQAETHAEKWNAMLYGIEERCAESSLVERADKRRVVADAWKEQRFGVGDAFRRSRAAAFRAETLQGPLDARDVASAIVDERHVHRSPFVLGRTLRRRLSRETAKRSARANALNIAST